jgi:hypothetical protein
MKKLIALIITIISFFNLVAQPVVTLTSGTTSTVQAAFTTLSNNGTVVIQGNITIDNNLTVPPGIVLNIMRVGMLTIQTSKTVTFQGGLSAGLYKVFDSSNTTPVVFNSGSVKEIDSEWFGDTDGAINQALRSATKIRVKVSRNRTIATSVQMASNQTLLIDDGVTLGADPNFADGRGLIENIDPTNGNDNISVVGGTLTRSTDTVYHRYSGIKFVKVKNARIARVRAIHLGKTAETAIGNFDLNQCTNALVEDVYIDNAHSMGLNFVNGSDNTIRGGIFKGCYDSGVAFDNSPVGTIDGAYVDHCGVSPTGASNMSLNSLYMKVINCTSKNSPHTFLGYGIVLGHNALPASYSICMNNLLIGNKRAGIIVQGQTDGAIPATNNILIASNIIKDNGLNNTDPNTSGVVGGILLWGNGGDLPNAVNSHLIRENTFVGNKYSICLNATRDIRIEQNMFVSNVSGDLKNFNSPTNISSVNNVFNSGDYRNSLVASKDFLLNTSASNGAQCILTGSTNVAKRLILGYDSISDAGIIQGAIDGSTWLKDVHIQKMGGDAHISLGSWNTGHLVIGTFHIWVNGGVLRGKNGAPISATDGSQL